MEALGNIKVLSATKDGFPSKKNQWSRGTSLKPIPLRLEAKEKASGAAIIRGQEEDAEDGGNGGKGKNKRKTGGGSEIDPDKDHRDLGDRYKSMLRGDPGNPLLLRNYGKYLHEVERDYEGAERCYGRAVAIGPEDGELLSLYGKLLWEVHEDEEAAEAYFRRAIEASPIDCQVLGCYAHFLWDVEEKAEITAKEERSHQAL